MSSHWDLFRQELAAWQGQGRVVPMWWRDDDACTASVELRRLLTLSSQSDVPLALAMIPAGAEALALEGMPEHLCVLQHGVDHRNRGTPQQKKTEFPESEPVSAMLMRLQIGRRILSDLFGARALPVLAPPWNRFPSTRVGDLAGAGFSGLSTYTARRSPRPAPGLCQVNTHVDIIDWHHGRVFVGEGEALARARAVLRARRVGQADVDEPLGWLTHHAVHDEAAWAFMAHLFEKTRGHAAVCWLGGQQVFAIPSGPAP